MKLTTWSLAAAALYLAPIGVMRGADATRASRDARSAVRSDVPTAVTIAPGKLSLAPEGREVQSVRKFEGQKVRGTGGDDLGDVKDLLIEPQSGRVAFAVVASGGLLGVGETLRLVPFASLHRTAGGEGFSMDLSQEQWREMPVLDRRTYSEGNISVSAANQRAAEQTAAASAIVRDGRTETRPITTEPDRIRRQDRVVDRTTVPAGAATGRTESATRRVESGSVDNVIRASTLRGKEIRSGDEKIGKIESVMLDWQSGAATAVLDLDRDFTGTNRKFLIPVSELAVRGEDQDVIITNLTRADFQQVARRDGSSDARLTPTGRSDVDQPVRTDRDRATSGTVVADPRSAALPDTEVSPTLASAVRSARQNIGNHPSLKTAEIEVLAYNGKLLLRGFAESEEMKERIEKAAKEGASGVPLENQILVRPRQR